MCAPCSSNGCLYNLAGPCIYDPTFSKLSQCNISLTHALRLAFIKVENEYPGFSEQFILRLLERLGVDISVDMPETYLKIASLPTHYLEKQNAAFGEIEASANLLRLHLSKIPDEICSSDCFTSLIREIAKTTEHFLESLSSQCNHRSRLKTLIHLKFVFIQSCKEFTKTLKTFSHDQNEIPVLIQANHLMLCTNTILDAIYSCDK
uniref:Programmed cell death protein 10 dimerisation domain-containing protein n=1 Tax=Trichobilharzia regenti TaxID=157069 RepID=A0AA85JWU1_TRIRE|nr:unnamed protein product [Trichobilharzia regenti]